MKIDIIPYAVISEGGTIISMLQTNEKGYRKSIENNQLWAVNPETDRLLPVDSPGRITGFREKDGWYEVIVKEEGALADEGPDGRSSDEEDSISTASNGGDASIIDRLYKIIEQRKVDMPEGSYTTHLFNSGMSKIRKKTGEEAIELLLAEDSSEIVFEAADLIYHMLVLFAAADIKPEQVFKELESRE